MLREWTARQARVFRLLRPLRAHSTKTPATKSAAASKSKALPYSPRAHQRSSPVPAAEQPADAPNRNNVFTRQFFSSFALWSVSLFVVGHLTTKHLVSVRYCHGPSMLPTIYYEGDWVLLSKLHAYMGWIQVGDLVSYQHPIRPGTRGIKRVIGMPGDFVLRDTPGEGEGMMVRIPPGHCWITGDNLDGSRDSRMFGALPLALIRGKVIARVSSPRKLFNDGLTNVEIETQDNEK